MAAVTVDYDAVLCLFSDDLTADLTDRQIDALQRVARSNVDGFLVADIPHLRDVLSVALQALTDKGAPFVAPCIALIGLFATPYRCLRANEEQAHADALADCVRLVADALFCGFDTVHTAAADCLLAFVTTAAFPASSHRAPTWAFHQAVLRASGGVEPLVTAFTEASTVLLTGTQRPATSGTPPESEGKEDARAQTPQSTSAAQRAAIVRSTPLLLTLANTLLEASEDGDTAAIITGAGTTDAVVQALASSADFRDPLVAVLLELLWNLCEHSSAAIQAARQPAAAARSLRSLLSRQRWTNALAWLGTIPALALLADLLRDMLLAGYTRADKQLRNDVVVLLIILARRVENRCLIASTHALQTLLMYCVAPETRIDVDAPYNNFATASEEDIEFKRLSWQLVATLATDTSSPRDDVTNASPSPLAAGGAVVGDDFMSCAEQVRTSLFVPALLLHVDPLQRSKGHPYLNLLLPAARRAFELQALHLLTLLADAFAEPLLACDGVSILTLYVRTHAADLEPCMAKQALQAARDGADSKLDDEYSHASLDGVAEPEVARDVDMGRVYAALRALSSLCGASVSSARLPPASDLVHCMPSSAEATHAACRPIARSVGVRIVDLHAAQALSERDEAQTGHDAAQETFLRAAVDSVTSWAPVSADSSAAPAGEPLGFHVAAVLGELGMTRDLISLVTPSAATSPLSGALAPGASAVMTTKSGFDGSMSMTSGGAQAHPSRTAEGRSIVSAQAVAEAALLLLADLTRGAADVALRDAAVRILGIDDGSGSAPVDATARGEARVHTTARSAVSASLETSQAGAYTVPATIDEEADEGSSDAASEQDMRESRADSEASPPAPPRHTWVTPNGQLLTNDLVERLQRNQSRARRAGAVGLLTRMLETQTRTARVSALPEAAEASATMPHITLGVVAALRCLTSGSEPSAAAFIAAGGVNALLDLIEVAPPAVLSPSLSLLADLCSHPAAAICVRTWRSDRTGETAPRVILDFWIAEEKRLGVTRDPNAGAITEGTSLRPLDTSGDRAAFKPLRRALAASRMWLHSSGEGTMPAFVGARVAAADLRPKLFSVLFAFGFEDADRALAEAEAAVVDASDSKEVEARMAVAAASMELLADLKHHHNVAFETARVFPTLLYGTAWSDVRSRLRALHVPVTAEDEALLQARQSELESTVSLTRAAQAVYVEQYIASIEEQQMAFAATVLAPKESDPRALRPTPPTPSAAGSAGESPLARRTGTGLLSSGSEQLLKVRGRPVGTTGSASHIASTTSMDERRIIAEAKQAMLSRSLVGYKPAHGEAPVMFATQPAPK